jgi:hypothetical protein
VDSGAEEVDSGPQGVDSGAEEVDSGPQGVDSGAEEVDSGPQGVDSGATRTANLGCKTGYVLCAYTWPIGGQLHPGLSRTPATNPPTQGTNTDRLTQINTD